jgi:hypothetical protein
VHLRICVAHRFQKNHRKKTNTQKTPSDGTVRQGSFVYLFICVFNNKITALSTELQRTVHSCRDETRLAVFSVPFPQNKFPNVFLPEQEETQINKTEPTNIIPSSLEVFPPANFG